MIIGPCIKTFLIFYSMTEKVHDVWNLNGNKEKGIMRYANGKMYEWANGDARLF